MILTFLVCSEDLELSKHIFLRDEVNKMDGQCGLASLQSRVCGEYHYFVMGVVLDARG